ncbi:MAG: electron transfer flavoprotein subunit alpha/FixB family protein [Fusobacterium sp.]|uniref:electron transfer flavoprotein subunit alpha/FixB family protein n=1 Tax=Fusobacterium sp. TaxID=68766 RepID=UPI0026DAA81E|nr:electron transfer flavoprotein subunit alpha/FixB family protein [Fusobacterium sp.]MDO4690174.1 electron transfer flavoprotein subunit alpha/FixB family protein [Fusobacterium sp.]
MNILLYIKEKKSLSSRSQELLNIASMWKKEQGARLFLAILENKSFLEEELKEWAIDKVFLLETQRENNIYEISHLFQYIVKKEKIDCIMLGNSLQEKEVAPYIAAYLKWNFIPNVISFILKDSILWRRFLYGSRAIEESNTKYHGFVVTFSGNIYKKDERKKVEYIETEKILSKIPIFISYLISAKKKKNIQKHPLETAKIVIGVGKGIKGKENFSMIEKLADLIGATIGVTRAVVDHGWRPEYEKIGQTGKIIKPELYLGFGISGAMQHMAGVQQARHIVMVNNNPNAESFRYSDFGIVADLFEVVPQLITLLKNI